VQVGDSVHARRRYSERINGIEQIYRVQADFVFLRHII
jgi:hypothetical protein